MYGVDLDPNEQTRGKDIGEKNSTDKTRRKKNLERKQTQKAARSLLGWLQIMNPYNIQTEKSQNKQY